MRGFRSPLLPKGFHVPEVFQFMPQVPPGPPGIRYILQSFLKSKCSSPGRVPRILGCVRALSFLKPGEVVQKFDVLSKNQTVGNLDVLPPGPVL